MKQPAVTGERRKPEYSRDKPDKILEIVAFVYRETGFPRMPGNYVKQGTLSGWRVPVYCPMKCGPIGILIKFKGDLRSKKDKTNYCERAF